MILAASLGSPWGDSNSSPIPPPDLIPTYTFVLKHLNTKEIKTRIK